MTPHRPEPGIATRIERQVAVCDNVIDRLAALDDHTMRALIADVRRLRASLQAQLKSLNGHRGGHGNGSGPPPSR